VDTDLVLVTGDVRLRGWVQPQWAPEWASVNLVAGVAAALGALSSCREDVSGGRRRRAPAAARVGVVDFVLARVS
jgi:hypothetical protein